MAVEQDVRLWRWQSRVRGARARPPGSARAWDAELVLLVAKRRPRTRRSFQHLRVRSTRVRDFREARRPGRFDSRPGPNARGATRPLGARAAMRRRSRLWCGNHAPTDAARGKELSPSRAVRRRRDRAVDYALFAPCAKSPRG